MYRSIPLLLYTCANMDDESSGDKKRLDNEEHLLSPSSRLRRVRRRRRRLFLYLTVAVLVCAVVGLGLGLGLFYGLKDSDSSGSGSNSGTYEHAAVATDAAPCSKVGADILRRGGSAVDAAIASLICVGVINFHSTGIGGGGFMVYYNATNKTATVIDYRETAPGRANSSMYASFGPNQTASLFGGLAIAVPGELRGLELAYKMFGKLPWKDLFEPPAEIADGFVISSALAKAIDTMKDTIINGGYKGLEELLAPNGKWLQEGDTIHREKYAKTLRAIGARGDASDFYEGELMKQMVAELQENGAIIEEEDFLNYTAIERDPIESEFAGVRVIGTPPPGSGAVISLILNILQEYKFGKSDFGSLSFHRIVESFKFAFGQRLRLGDPEFNDTIPDVVDFMLMNSTAEFMHSRIQDNTTHDPDYYLDPMIFSVPSDYGTSHLCVLAPNGDAVAATSTINNFFGSLIRSETSGIIFNNEMDDFSIPTRENPGYLPATITNYIEPGKRPQSSTTPTILLDGDKVKMVVGASGGTKITTATAQVILDVLNFDKDLSNAISYPRLHHQLYPNYIRVEESFSQEYRKGLEERNHVVVESSSYAVVQGILRSGKYIHATSDARKGGEPDGY